MLDATQESPVRNLTLSQLAPHEKWRVELPHSRAEHFLLALTKGQGRVIVEGRRRGLAPGTVLFVPAGTQMLLDINRQSFGQVVLIHPRVSAPFPLQPQFVRLLGSLAQTEMMGIIDAMQREHAAGQAFLFEALEAHATLLSVWLRRNAQGDEAISNAAMPAADRLATAFSICMERDFRNGFSVAEFAAKLGVTPTHLTRTLKQTSGLGAAELLTGRCLHEARHLLQDRNEPIGLVAQMLGFSSAAYFTRFVRNNTGSTPSTLRQHA